MLLVDLNNSYQISEMQVFLAEVLLIRLCDILNVQLFYYFVLMTISK